MDIRADRSRVGSKKNGCGTEMAPIVAENNVPAMFSKAIEAELVGRGFVLGTGSARLLVELQKFYNDFKSGFWSGTAVAELLMNVQVKDSRGNILFARIVTGNGSLPRIQLTSGENAKVALEEALKDGLANLFNDRDCIDAIFKAAGAAPLQVSRQLPTIQLDPAANSNAALSVNEPL